MRTYTLESYCSNGQVAFRVHPGTFEQVRDSLSPQMYWARDFRAPNIRHARLKCHALVRVFKAQGADLKKPFCPMPARIEPLADQIRCHWERLLTRAEAEEQARHLSTLNAPRNVWLVVDCQAEDSNPRRDYRVWNEQTIREQPPAIWYEVLARAEGGKLEVIA